jgi:chromosomal replication initiation ATPase DnaA
MIQAALPLDWPADEADDSFITTPSNADAVRHLDRIGTWPVWATLLVGPRKSGRSLLGRIFVRRTGGRLIDDADRADERAVFNAWNEAQDQRRPLLMIADAPPPGWAIALPDLRSRIAASPVIELGEPDDLLVRQLLSALLARRGLVLTAEAEAYLWPRAPRSHRGVIALVDALDSMLLARKGGRITVPVARSVLDPAFDAFGKAR